MCFQKVYTHGVYFSRAPRRAHAIPRGWFTCRVNGQPGGGIPSRSAWPPLPLLHPPLGYLSPFCPRLSPWKSTGQFSLISNGWRTLFFSRRGPAAPRRRGRPPLAVKSGILYSLLSSSTGSVFLVSSSLVARRRTWIELLSGARLPYTRTKVRYGCT